MVDKLLTGFDAPVNTVLYLCRTLREHTLLQAIARVNRLHKGKDFGYIVDYEGILGELNTALTMYDALEGFDEKDLEHTLVSVNEQIEKLPQKRSHLWDVFREVKNQADEEEYERLLSDDERRDDFYRLLAGICQNPCRCPFLPQVFDGHGRNNPAALQGRFETV